VLAAVNVTGVPLVEQRFVIFGFGSAGRGISELLLKSLMAAGLSEAEARRRFWAVDKDGLLIAGLGSITEQQAAFARSADEAHGWKYGERGAGLLEVVEQVRPTVLVGVSGQSGAFREDVVRAMQQGLRDQGRGGSAVRPVILPLSNPTSRCEASPADILKWTDGQAIVGTGSPFAPVEVAGSQVKIAQTNNSYIFPGLALGILASRAKRVSEGMIMAGAEALARLSPTRDDPNGALLPPLESLRKVSMSVAVAVGRQAAHEGLAQVKGEAFVASLRESVWEPVYLPYKRRK
jgi:malate dehydrogenase (oxaloacetate-decarboxylating)